MGSQFSTNSIPSNIIVIMKFLVVLSLVASAFASPIDLTPEVAKATEEHLAAHAAATAGEHAALAPAAVVNAYLDDAADVAAAKAEFQKAFDLYASGSVPAPVAPVFAPAATAATVAATIPAPLYNGFYGFPHLNAYGGYGTFAGINTGYPYYSGYPYAGYPYAGWGPVVTAPAAEATE